MRVVLSDNWAVDMARRVRLDVRWDPEDVLLAEGIAAGRGVRAAAVMREAVKIGLAAMRGGRSAAESTSRAGASAGGDIVPGAGTAPPAGPPASSPRPAPAARPAGVKLIHVVARRLARGAQPQPVDVARARRRIETGRVYVGDAVCVEPDRLVIDAEVGLA